MTHRITHRRSIAIRPTTGCPQRAGSARGATATCLALAATALALAAPTPAVAQRRAVAAAPATAVPAPMRNSQLGIVHIDVMDLHAVRLPDAPPADREELSAEALDDRYRQAGGLGVTWHRWSAYWDLVERAGTDTWGVTDGMVARDQAHDLSSLIVLQGNQPGVRNQTGAPEGLDQPAFLRADGTGTDDPAAAAQVNPANRWARFVNAVVARYRPSGELAKAKGWRPDVGVRAWQMGNEPNLTGFWRGTPAEYARLLEVGTLVVKRLDPGATVVHAGIADDANAADWYGRFADALAARAAASPLPKRFGYYFDAAAWHWYRAPGLLATGPGQARAILAARGIPVKPLWVTELGVPVWSEAPGPCWDPASPGRVTLAEQAGFAWQALAEALANGAERVFFFQLYDDCGNGPASYDAFGLVRNQAGNACWSPPGKGCWSLNPTLAGTPRPAYAALRLAASELAGSRPAGPVATLGGWRQATFFRADGARVVVAWSLGASVPAATIATGVTEATLHTLDDNGAVVSRRVAPANGRYVLRLPGVTNRNNLGGRPILLGTPVIIVEPRGVGVAPAAPAAAGASSPAQTGAATSPGPASVADDKAPPVLAIVSVLPAESPARFDLTVLAEDDGSGLDAYIVYAARGPAQPRAPADWQPVGTVQRWPGRPLIGKVKVRFDGKPGEVWHFAAQAGDRAGNWTPFPTYVQASTRVKGQPAPARRTGAR
jgi:hypothetical protein